MMTKDNLEGDERRLIRDVLSGDRESFAGLVRAHEGRVRSLCLSILRDPAEAEDAAQDVFIKAFKGLAAFRSDASVSTWLYRIAVNTCKNRLASKRTQLP